ncbi:MAG: T9SS type A sorting domain-containing protein, partial [Bacteroidetes bacterium]|nr:T9SS type A sorting domain-containing protein [Bacteroidota bacterium]
PAVTSFGWTQYYVDVQVPEDALSLSMRLHPLGRFQGTVFMDAMEITKINDVTEIAGEQFLPTEYNLFQNYPNPFNPSTIISYSIPQSSIVTIRVFDMLGREIRTLISEEQNAGMQKAIWDGKNNYGSKVSSGTYIYRIDAGEFHMAKKMLLLK